MESNIPEDMARLNGSFEMLSFSLLVFCSAQGHVAVASDDKLTSDEQEGSENGARLYRYRAVRASNRLVMPIFVSLESCAKRTNRVCYIAIDRQNSDRAGCEVPWPPLIRF